MSPGDYMAQIGYNTSMGAGRPGGLGSTADLNKELEVELNVRRDVHFL